MRLLAKTLAPAVNALGVGVLVTLIMTSVGLSCLAFSCIGGSRGHVTTTHSSLLTAASVMVNATATWVGVVKNHQRTVDAGRREEFK